MEPGALSFASDLRVGFDDVCKYTDEGLKQTKDVISLLKKRQAIENEYAKSMAKLAQHAKSLVPEQKRLVYNGSDSLASFGSLWTCWFNFLQGIQYTAMQHEQFALNLGEKVGQVLNTNYKDAEAKRKHYIAEGQRYNKALQEAYTGLKKAQAYHSACQKEAEEAREASDKAKHNFQSKDSTVAKLVSKTQAAQEKADQAWRTLQDQEKACNQLQEAHYSRYMPSILQDLEDTEMDRARLLKECLARTAQVGLERAERVRDSVHRANQLACNINIRCDIDEFITRHKQADNDDIPVTSILNATLKGHLSVRTLESSKFKDHVFVLVGSERRLYEYESENSQHPKEVISLPRGHRVVRPVDDSLFNRRHCFQLMTPARTYFLAATDSQVCQQWHHLLYQICSGRRKSRIDVCRIVKSLELRLCEAKELPKTGEYYCLIFLDDELQARSKSKSNTQTPFWNQDFCFDDLPRDVEVITVQVFRSANSLLRNLTPSAKQASVIKRKVTMSVRRDSPRRNRPSDSDVAKSWKESDHLIGSVAIPVASLSTKDSYKEAWHELDVPESGALRLRISFTDDFVRPLREYQALQDIFTRSSDIPATLQALDKVIPASERVSTGTTLMGITYHCEQLMEFLLTLCQTEIDATNDDKTLFRGNSLASKTIDQFMKIKTIEMSPYLTNTLGVAVQTIYEAKSSCEVDPTRINGADPQREIQQNWKKLLANTRLVWNSVLHSIQTCPSELKYLFARLRDMVSVKFSSPEARQAVIAGFFFLRLICPAIMGPQLFGLQEHHPEDNTARTLTLISKTIQNLANGVSFGAKEPYMLPMNEFITENQDRMRQCLEHICSPPAGQVKATLAAVEAPRLLASLQRILYANLQSLETLNEPPQPHLSNLIQVVKDLKRPEGDLPQESEYEQYEEAMAKPEREKQPRQALPEGAPMPTNEAYFAEDVFEEDYEAAYNKQPAPAKPSRKGVNMTWGKFKKKTKVKSSEDPHKSIISDPILQSGALPTIPIEPTPEHPQAHFPPPPPQEQPNASNQNPRLSATNPFNTLIEEDIPPPPPPEEELEPSQQDYPDIEPTYANVRPRSSLTSNSEPIYANVRRTASDDSRRDSMFSLDYLTQPPPPSPGTQRRVSEDHDANCSEI
eukprot:m.156743 g.156743  ORF g.156743 m.156743 type:complete len:1139 (-) comp24699_c0_seq7:130-3546(-)